LGQERARLVEALEDFERADRELQDAGALLELAQEGEPVGAELGSALQALPDELGRLELEALMQGEHDANNAIGSLHSGAGGTEAQDWVAMLLRMYTRWCERRGFKVELVDSLPGEEAGLKSVTFTVSGRYAYGYLKAEIGVHRLVRISPFDAAKRRHTSFASVFVWPELDESIAVKIEDKDLRIDTFRSSGAGGQHVNVTDSAVRITHLPSGIVVQCQNERSQHRNRDLAMKVLMARLYELERKKKLAQLEKVEESKLEIGFGSQIRSYVLQPYQMVKDHRSGTEIGDVQSVLDGGLDPLIEGYLSHARSAAAARRT
jgi:peptide chain release factor 2